MKQVALRKLVGLGNGPQAPEHTAVGGSAVLLSPGGARSGRSSWEVLIYLSDSN